MYLVGKIGEKYFLGEEVLLKKHITREDLGRAREESDFQVINLDDGMFFDADENQWVEIKKEV